MKKSLPEITEAPITDEARHERIYHSMARELLGDALTRLAWYQKKFNLPIETAKGLTADVVITFYES